MANTHDIVEYGSGKKTLKAYLIGLGLCLVLTFVAFSLVEMRLLTDTNLYIGLALLAIAQLFVQSVCFLRLNFSSHGRWNLLPFLFALLIVAVLVGGTLWIMYNMNYNMLH